ncbi:MAG: hypothetical protein KGM24_10365, partial [Elusimicrobia bacterium]|nr:hypothetical protein [Elusimicrobiota bacterium]
RRWAAGAAAVLAAAALVVPAWRAASAWRYSLVSAAPAPSENPTALAYGDGRLWVTDWTGGLAATDPGDPRKILLRALPAAGGPYRPTAIAVGAGSVWTLDAAQGRLLRGAASDPARVLSSRPSPGPAPTALAFDGDDVWSYDAVDRALTRHGAGDAPEQSYALERGVVPNAMAWVGGRLWIHDAKSGRMLVYVLRDGALARVASEPSPGPGVIGFAAAGTARRRSLFVLYSPSGERSRPEIALYKMRSLVPFAHF